MMNTSISADADASVGQLLELAEISRSLTYASSLDQVAQTTVDRGAALLNATAVVLMVPQADGLMHVLAAHGVREGLLDRFRAPMTDELTGRLQGLLGVRDERFVAVPLVVAGAVTGIVAVAIDHPATPQDEWLLSALADMASVTLENARLSGDVRVEMEDRLRVSESATGAKDRALSVLAHDIRSPLGAIEGYCAIMENGLYGPVTEKQREGLARIRMSGQHLLALLDNVMDMARLNAGVATVKLAPVLLSAVARDAIDIMRPAAETKSQTLTLSCADEVEVIADADRLRQVLVNLIGNAVKFTADSGSVRVDISFADETSDDSQARAGVVTVSDTGPGIATAERAAIFEPYYRSENTARAPGIGLGLAISHALLQQMGGDLKLTSEVDVGSSFIITLPSNPEPSRSKLQPE
jgi:signal transduction histidine kinase